MNNKFTLFALASIFLILTQFRAAAQTYTLSWGSSMSTAWAAGATSGSATNIGGSGKNCTVSMAFSGATGNAYISGYPQVNANNSNTSIFQVQGSNDALELGINLASKTSYLTVTLTFSGPVQNVKFGFSDIDGPASTAGASPYGYLDSISVIGNGPSGTVIPTVTKYNSGSAIINIDATNQVSANPANGTNVSSTAQGSPAQDGTAFYDFSGTAAVTSITIVYTTKNHSTVQTDPASEAIGLGNISFSNSIAPVASNVTNTILANGLSATSIQSLSATDDESIASYTITSLPSAASGVLSYNNGSAYVNVLSGQVLTPTQMATLRFDPDPSFTGNTTFTYIATDNRGLTSNTATYTLPIEPTPAPVANNIEVPQESSSFGQTSIPALSAAVSAGSITSYTIQTIPGAVQGILYLCNSTCNPVSSSQVISVTDIDKLKFDPAGSFSGVASFTYYATSNSGAVSNIANYDIPVVNNPPVANTIMAQVINNATSSTVIPALTGADADGTVTSYTIAALPSVSEGTLNYCNTTCVAATAGQVIAAANADKLQFVPNSSFAGISRFTYTATDNSNNVSQSANYNIPVKGSASINMAPAADNMLAPKVINTSGAVLLPSVSAYDADGTLASYTIESAPAAAQGTISYCSNGTQPCTGTVNTISGVVSLTPLQVKTLKFTPLNTFSGTAIFTWSVTDNTGNKSNVASYKIPVADVAPVANPVVTPVMSNSYAATAIPSLSGYAMNGISNFTISAIPSAASGVITLCNTTCNAVSAGQFISPSDISKLKFDPAAGFTGNATFSYTVTDVAGSESAGALYTIPVITGTIPSGISPVASNIKAPAMANNAAQVSIPSLNASDADGTISSYAISSLPSSGSGTLYLCNTTCNTVTAGQVISTADVSSLQFKPLPGFEGNALFNYSAVDNSGKTSNLATYTIPVTNVAPLTVSQQSANMPNTASLTSISSLSGSDADGTVSSYTVNSLPAASSGLLYLCNGACNLVTIGQVITAADAGKLQFDPASTYSGLYTSFNYTASDNSGKLGNIATYTISMFYGNPLPVHLISFDGKMINDQAELTWQSENELSMKQYVVERSTDGARFSGIKNIAARSATGKQSYNFSDDIYQLEAKTIYYRLRMIDNDGTSKYSRVLSFSRHSDQSAVVLISPNPVIGNVRVQLKSGATTTVQLILADNTGKILVQQQSSVSSGDNIVIMDRTDHLPSGMYTLMVVSEYTILNQKVLVQH